MPATLGHGDSSRFIIIFWIRPCGLVLMRAMRRHCQAVHYVRQPIYKRLVVSTSECTRVTMAAAAAAKADDRSQPIISRQSAERNVSIIYPPISVSISLFPLSTYISPCYGALFSISTRIPAIQSLFTFYNSTLTRKNVNFRFLFAKNGGRVHGSCCGGFTLEIGIFFFCFDYLHTLGMEDTSHWAKCDRNKKEKSQSIATQILHINIKQMFFGADAQIKWIEWIQVEWDLQRWASACDCHINLFAIESMGEREKYENCENMIANRAKYHRTPIAVSGSHQCWCHSMWRSTIKRIFRFFSRVSATVTQ